ncbi:hypothetical protein ACFSO7_09245 [Bacillus sp. CGMCC 1.16607]|uniref:hypothetical protein n=1 Tax=Bacillus sp. CGMCC 1.16607 TaxID=3351842 RepID=UPI0036324835
MLRLFKSVRVILLLTLLVSCSTNTEQKNVEINAYSDLVAQFAFKNSIYSIEGTTTPKDKLEKEIGEIEEIVDEIAKNAEGKNINSKFNLTEGSKVFSIRGVDSTVVAVKYNNIYYTAVYTKELN